MKKIFVFLIVCFSVITVSNSQNIIPNAGFENWETHIMGNDTVNNPTGYFSTNNGMMGLVSVEKVTDAHSGSFAVKIRSIRDTVPSGAIVGTSGAIISDYVDSVGYYPTRIGVPYSLHPSTLTGYFKYIQSNPLVNTSTIRIIFTKWNAAIHKSDTLGKADYFPSANTTVYTQFNSTINWTVPPSAMPDTMCLIISTSNTNPTHYGNELWIDDLSLEFTSGIESTIGNNYLTISPNPTSSTITLTIPKLFNTNITITNLTGNEVATYNLQNTTNKTIDVSHLAEGVYFVTLKSDEGVVTKKVIKQ